MTAYASLGIFTVYHNPLDYPGKFVVRRSVVSAGRVVTDRDPLAVVWSLEQARAAIPRGLTRLPRMPEDEIQIVEVWL
jgi:hypothetical protein